jgi:pimeloyl-ACP methyl ester carboxylesterase
MDLRGHGRSSGSTEVHYNVLDFIDDILTLLRHVGIEENVVAMGHGLGGLTVSYLAVLAPHLVKGIVLIEPSYNNTPAVTETALQELYNEPDVHKFAVAYILDTLVVPTTPDWMRTWYTRRAIETPDHVLYKVLEESFRQGALGRTWVHQALIAGRRNCPRMVGYEYDENVEQEKALGMGELDQVFALTGVGHWPHQCRDVEFNWILNNWLGLLEG